jgi:hypothetical protein
MQIHYSFVTCFIVADLYTLIFNQARSSSNFDHGREGMFFGANGEHRMYDVAEVPPILMLLHGHVDVSLL